MLPSLATQFYSIVTTIAPKNTYLLKEEIQMFEQLKVFARIITSLNGFTYDIIRFIKYSALKHNMNDREIRNYHLVKIYHALEKTMSYKSRNPKYGWATAFLLIDILKKANNHQSLGYHDYLGAKILNLFINLPENKHSNNSEKISKELASLKFVNFTDSDQAVKPYSIEEFHKGILVSPEDFFLSRFTLREFSNKKVENDVIKRAISLSIKTPSVCNRQPWHIYYTSERALIDEALSYQSGNRGFGHLIPNLMIITADLKAFMTSDEHYQHWIDGGMVSMSMIYAFHSLGLASCCLNWSQTPKNDKKLRERFHIKSNHTIIMFLAFGWPNENNIVCASERRPLNSFSTKLELR